MPLDPRHQPWTNRSDSLEELAYHFMPDKARDDHGYTDLYAMLFDPLRQSMRNFTEIGIGGGNSLLPWHEYFPNAHIWGLDTGPEHPDRGYGNRCPRGRMDCKQPGELAQSPRMHLLVGDSSKRGTMRKYGFEPETMDVVIDDGAHSVPANQLTLEVFWPFVKPGGFYIVEDIAAGGNLAGHVCGGRRGDKPLGGGISHFVHRPNAFTRRIMHENDVFFVNPKVGHRNLDALKTAFGPMWVRDVVNHGGHILVIKKKIEKRRPTFQMRGHT